MKRNATMVRAMLAAYAVSVCTLSLAAVSEAARVRSLAAPLSARPAGGSLPEGVEPYTTHWFEQELDHFSFVEHPTWKQRYLTNDQFWGKGKSNPTAGSACPGPILFYTGNEGDITLFWENTGFMTDYLIKEMGALVVFTEHRYYGQSLPFGPHDSFKAENMRFLTTEQALADYAKFMRWFKSNTTGAEDCPVVALGGSYGGMLAAWFRVKYPWVVDGAISASAPILEFEGVEGYSQFAFNQIITDDFAQTQFGGAECADTLRKGFVQLMQLGKTAEGRAELEKTFRPCRRINDQNDVDALYAWLDNGFAYEAMADYPYPANFLEPMPGYPINVSCSEAMKVKSNPVQALMAAVSVYYNYSGAAGACSNLSKYSTGALGMIQWDYQACTEMAMPISSNSASMFLPSYYNEAAYVAGCKEQFSVQTRPRWVPLQFGGRQLASGVSNIVFSNGMLDPWRSGGVTESLSDSVVAVVIEGGAHHLDLRTPNVLDPASVKAARALEEKHIRQWCAEKLRGR